MRILAIGDKESKSLWDYFQPEKLEGVDLIISVGDLDPAFLSFLATFTHAPVYYVHGNHDEKYEKKPPDGCECLDGRIVVYEGVRILGLPGALRYRPGSYQYEQEEMDDHIRRLFFSLQLHGGFDILVTHAPAEGVGDGQDRPHQGFRAFTGLLNEFRPRYYLHGHVHPNYSREYTRLKRYRDTLIINGYESYIFDYETEYEEKFPKVKEKEGYDFTPDFLLRMKKEREKKAAEEQKEEGKRS
ncbi:MAG: metallophosphoesterase [Lachnospiraceae bacterium]|nr:metallophosphoesterase [Lachnospiraceae bacterium]